MPSPLFAPQISEATPKPIHALRQARFKSPGSALLHVHVIFVLASSNQGMLKPAHVKKIRHIFSGICRTDGAEMLQVKGFEDQLHLLIEYPATLPIAELLTTLQSETLPDWQWNDEFFVGTCQRSDLMQQMRCFVDAVRRSTEA